MVLSKETSLFQKDAIAGLRIDVDGAMSSSVPIYYRRNPQDHAADPEQPDESTQIYDIDYIDNVWTYAMPQPKKGCYFYTCERYTSVSGAVTYSAYKELHTDTYLSKWVKDANETYIDGGSLYTGSVTADKMAANSITVGKMDDDAKNQTLNSNIKIGGKNLLRGTQDLYITGAGRWIDGRFYKSGSGGDLESVTGTAPIRSISHMIKATITTANGSVGLAQAAVPLMQDTITVSAWVKGTTGDKITMQTCWSNTSGSEELTGVAKEYTIADSNWHRYTHTYDMQHNQISGISAGYVYVKSATSGHVFYICGIKLEYGNKATDWSPAPEDTIHDNLLPDSQSMSSYGIGSESTRTNNANKLNYVAMSNTTDQAWNASLQTRPTLDPAILDGTPLWLSFEYQFTGADESNIAIAVNGCAAAPGSQTVSLRTMYTSLYPVITKATGWTRFVVALPTSVSDLTTQQSGQTDTTINSVYIQIWNYKYADTTLRIRKLKLEHGDYASMWTQSSQDHQAYITYIDRDTGIRVHNAGNTTDYIQLNSNGLDVYRASKSMAQFGATVRIGEDNKQRILTTSTALEMYDSNNQLRANISTDGLNIFRYYGSARYNIANFGYVNNGVSSCRIGRSDQEKIVIKPSGVDVYGYAGTTQKLICHLGHDTTNGTNGNVTEPYFVFGDLDSSTSLGLGAYSLSVGDTVRASGYCSCAIGEDVSAKGHFSCAIGNGTSTTGYYSCAFGYNLSAKGTAQVVVGKNNVEDTSSVFIVGNGENGSSRSTALKVNAADGKLTIEGHASPIGTIKDVYPTEEVSVLTNTGTDLCSLILEKGVWVISAGVRFPFNSTGYRRANVSNSQGSSEVNIQQMTVTTSSSPTQLRFTVIVAPTANTRYYLNAYHTAGTTLKLPAGGANGINFMRAVRIA